VNVDRGNPVSAAENQPEVRDPAMASSVRSPWMEIRPITVSMSVRLSFGVLRDQDRQRHGT